VRAEIPPAIDFIHAKVTALSTSAQRQTLTLSNGEEISARLVVLANGLNVGLRQSLGMERNIISAGHSLNIGFDLKPVGRRSFGFPALTFYGRKTSDRMALLTLFPIGSVMRANLFTYRDLHDPWLQALREAPQETLLAAMPGLEAITGNFEVQGFIKIRPVDLYVTTGHRQPGVVLAGDAFSTSCPAAGTGTSKVLTDVERLCNVHIPRWLATPGMDEDKIGEFYDDPVKRACDEYSAAKAFWLRSFSIEPGITWQARRWIKFLGQLGVGSLRAAHERLAVRSPAGTAPTAAPASRRQ
jgi:2-polyprenyl-6-methoxyphenol hydroxylase-like FAD-dependent oxidoreductase